MIAFLGFFGGQILAIILQVARWIDDTRGWGDYFRHRKKQGQHVADMVGSVIVFFAWGTGLLASFAGLFPDPIPTWIEKLPAEPAGPMVAAVVGFGLTFATRYVAKKYFDKPEPPPTSGDTPVEPKGD